MIYAQCLAAPCADEYTITYQDISIKTPPKCLETKSQHLPDSVSKVQFNNLARSSNIKSDFKSLSPPTCTYFTKEDTPLLNVFR